MTEENTNLFGEKVPVLTPQGKCSHLNARYTLATYGSVHLESIYRPGKDGVEEIERSQTWNGLVQGRCHDCGKNFYYTGSNLPKFIKRRLVRVPALREELGGATWLG